MTGRNVSATDRDLDRVTPEDYLQAVERQLDELTRTSDARYRELFTMFRYHLGWSDENGREQRSDPGKRVRPLVCLWACAAAGGEWREALPAAAAIELIHNFSLIHDDIEDRGEARRGRAALWKVWGLAQGVNAGDAMFVLAHLALDQLGADLSLARYREIHAAFHRATFRLTQGQFLDLEYERASTITVSDYLEMVRGKTAALLKAACEIGARIGTASEEVILGLARYGENLGIAFQISDDVLGLWGDPARTGKPAHADVRARKKSYPVLVAMQGARGQELRELYALPAWTDEQLTKVEQLLAESGARSVSTAKALAFAERARAALDDAGLSNGAARALAELLGQIVNRDK